MIDFLKYIPPTFDNDDSIFIVGPSLTIKEVESVPFITINLFGFIFNVPVPDIVKVAPLSKYIVPSFSFDDESVKVDSLVKNNFTSFPELIRIGVNELLLDNVKEFKFKVLDDDTIIFLFVTESSKSYSPSVEIVISLSETVYPSPEEVKEIFVDNSPKENK